MLMESRSAFHEIVKQCLVIGCPLLIPRRVTLGFSPHERRGSNTHSICLVAVVGMCERSCESSLAPWGRVFAGSEMGIQMRTGGLGETLAPGSHSQYYFNHPSVGLNNQPNSNGGSSIAQVPSFTCKEAATRPSIIRGRQEKTSR